MTRKVAADRIGLGHALMVDFHAAFRAGEAILAGCSDDPQSTDRVGENYTRVDLLDPNARWTTYDAVKNGLPLLEDVPGTIQERAWISPIWYLPKK